MRRLWVASILLLAIAGWSGCGPGGFDTIPIRGKVTLDGKPLTNARIRYEPVDESGRVAWSALDENGEFALTTLHPHDGALPGEYGVAIMAFEEGSGGRDRERERQPQESGLQYLPKSRIPEKYLDPAESQLRDTVDGSHPGYREFNLSSKE